MGDTFLTKSGLKKLEKEQNDLMRAKRELTEEVNKAAALGDLRENAEYHAARNKLEQVSARLVELLNKLSSVRIIDELEVKEGEARLGVKVTLKDLSVNDEFSYVLVGSDEADPTNGTISIESPLGRAMLGKKPGEEFELTLPRGKTKYRIVKLKKS